MNEKDRQQRIVDFLKDRPFASVRELQEVLPVSPATIRRDIAKLNATGAVRKVFGGMAANGGQDFDRLAARPFEQNQTLAVEAKRAIAAAAEALVSDGDAIIIHGGSTCLMFALRLAHRNLRVFTNSMPLAAALGQHGTCHLTVTGGDLYREPGVLYSGAGTLPDFYASRLFIGAQAIGPQGVLESSPLIVREAEKLLARADEVVVLADSGKFALRARATAIPISRIGTLVTDDGVSEADHAMLEQAGIRVIIARTERGPTEDRAGLAATVGA